MRNILDTSLCLHSVLRFFSFSNFQRLCLMSINKSWGNSYPKFIILAIKFRFTCAQLNLYGITKILLSVCLKLFYFQIAWLKKIQISRNSLILAKHRKKITTCPLPLTNCNANLCNLQFVIFRPLSYCFEETVRFEAKVSF